MGVLETFRTTLTLCVCFSCLPFANSSRTIVSSLLPAGEGVSGGSSGVVYIFSSTTSKIRLVGVGVNNISKIMFTPHNISCTGGKTTESFSVTQDNNSAIVTLSLDSKEVGDDVLHVCAFLHDSGGWKHLGSNPWLSIQVKEPEGSLLPLWLQISIITVLLLFSGLFSGLNLGLMSLDQTELAIIQKVGSESEKKHARRIFPLRKRGNFLLCTLLLGNVMVNSSFTILFDNLTNGLIAIISSTIGIVIFGEIIPQAICSRHGLAVGAKTYWITRFFMVATFPLSFPISLVLDKILGEEIGQIFNKEKLQELIRMTADQRVLHDNEANIMSGALQLTSKSVEDVMTKIEDVYMLELNTMLDFDTLTEIMRHGYTRVPVYEKEKTNIVNLLNTKELALIDPDDKTQLRTVCRFYDHKPLYVDYDLKLDVMLQEFLQGNCHMAIVQKLHNTENKDPYFENIGVVTLEDVIEEILQSEIIDETDRMIDNRKKQPVSGRQSNFLFPSEVNKSKLPRQLEFVAFQFLSSNIEAFSETHLNRNVLKNLMKKNIVINLNPTTPVSDKNYLFRKGQPTDQFVLILQGTVEVTIGDESLVFESGPFTYYGVEAINSLRKMSTQDLKRLKDYIPDYSVCAITPVQYLCIKKFHYMAAVRTSKMLRSQRLTMDDNKVENHFDMELAKLTDRNDSNNRVVDVYSATNLPLESLKYDDSPKKRSTSSLDRVLSLTRRHDSLTRMKRSGSDAKDRPLDSSPEFDRIERSKKLSESSTVEHSDTMFSDREETDRIDSPPGLVSQTSHPFTPNIQSEDPSSNSQGSSNIWSEPVYTYKPSPNAGHEDAADTNRTCTGDDKSGIEISTGNDALEKVPLVDLKQCSQNAGSDNPGLSGKFEPYTEPEAVPLMQHSEKSGDYLKDSTSSQL